MKSKKPIGDATTGNELPEIELELHAFIDGELASADQARVISAAKQSAIIHTRIVELQQLKEMVRNSYANITAPRKMH